MGGVTVVGALDPVLGWDGERAYVTEDVAAGVPPPARLDGAAAGFEASGGGGACIFRDGLGLGKLFWVRDRDNAIVVAARPIDLVRAGHDFEDIMALPRGRIVAFDGDGRVASDRVMTGAPPRPAPASLAEAGGRIRKTLDDYLAAIAAAYPNRRAYLCLSGGLDSSTIAVLARRHFPNLTAASFDVAGPSESEDRVAARRLADDLGVPMIEVTVSVEALLSYLDVVLAAGIDWRDFNVHCGLVNAALGDAIAQHQSKDEPPALVITGDLSNEFLADYHTEILGGAVYYALPRLGPERLRTILVNGLDTCHREVGVFGAFGLTVLQPYAACAEAYLSLPADFLGREDRKARLVEEIVGGDLPDYVYRRRKVRAQVGTADGGGALAACVDNGIDGAWLRRRFAALHRVREDGALHRFIRAGRYRSATPDRGRQIHGDE